MRKFCLIALLILICLGGACAYFLSGAYIGRQITEISARSGAQLHFRHAPSVSLLPPLLSFSGIDWTGTIHGLPARLTVKSGSIKPDLLSFISGKATLREVVLEKPELILGLGESRQPEAPGLQMPMPERLVIKDGSVRCCGLRLENLRLTATSQGHETEAQSDFVLATDSREIGNLAVKTDIHYQTPNTTFRDGSLTFTATNSSLAPVQAQFSGTVARKAANSSPDFNFSIELADIKYHGLVFEDTAFRITGANDSYDIRDFTSRLADGKLAGNASLGPAEFSVSASGRGISLGRAFEESGLRGFKGGQTRFSLNLAGNGTDAQQRLASLTGNGSLESSDLRLDPFGEISLLLPLLGKIGKFTPDAGHSLAAEFVANAGEIRIGPVKLLGPGLTGTGSAILNAANGNLVGKLELSWDDLHLPILLSGALPDLHWQIGNRD